MTAVTTRIAVKIIDERIRPHLPAYATPGSAGMDLRACIDTPRTLAPGQVELIPTGIAIHIADAGACSLDPAAFGTRPQARHRARQSGRTDRFRLPGTASRKLLEPQRCSLRAAADGTPGSAHHRSGRACGIRSRRGFRSERARDGWIWQHRLILGARSAPRKMQRPPCGGLCSTDRRIAPIRRRISASVIGRSTDDAWRQPCPPTSRSCNPRRWSQRSAPAS